MVDGPPMFMKTIAVGPFDDVASCVTGGATVAIDRAKLGDRHRCLQLENIVGVVV